jgi:protein TonB
VVDVQELTPPTPDAKPAPPPSPAPPEVVPDDHIIAEPTFEPPDEIDLEPGSETTVPPPPEPASEKERDEPFVVVEQMPEPKGGLSALYENLEYPRAARQAGVEGRVVLQFVVRPDGSVEDVTVLKGVNRWLDKAAIEAVKETEFTPGRQRDRAVPVRMTLPVTFRLN